jgi:thiamine biosynthesis lipoprotein
MQRIEAAQLLLGTLVQIRVQASDAAHGQHACSAAFAEVARIHAAMSFHETGSDVARLNAAAHAEAVSVDRRTHRVLQRALALFAQSQGHFDVTVAPLLVANGALPAPLQTARVDPAATSQDIHLLAGRRVHFRRSLWLDLGGIAKGYAVDRAVAVLRGHGIRRGSVNAGGDLRVFGGQCERVLLRSPRLPRRGLPVIELGNRALATSSTNAEAQPRHWHGPQRRAICGHTTVVVAARQAWLADGLTKIALADMRVAARCLAHHRARAYVQRAGAFHGMPVA